MLFKNVEIAFFKLKTSVERWASERKVDETLTLCSHDIAAITEVSSLLQQELMRSTDDLDASSRKNAEMVYVLSMAIPTLKDLLNKVRLFSYVKIGLMRIFHKPKVHQKYVIIRRQLRYLTSSLLLIKFWHNSDIMSLICLCSCLF